MVATPLYLLNYFRRPAKILVAIMRIWYQLQKLATIHLCGIRGLSIWVRKEWSSSSQKVKYLTWSMLTLNLANIVSLENRRRLASPKQVSHLKLKDYN